MNTQDFETFARDTWQRQGRIPLSGAFEITGRCNLRCIHCYMRDYRPGLPELDTDEARRILDQLAEAGCLHLLVTGGEPLLRADFQAIWLHAHTLGMRLTLFTNATLADDEVAAFLHERPPVFCEVSIYGASPATYEKIAGRPEAFEQTLAGIERLRRALPYVGAKSMLMRENLDDNRAMARLCEERGVAYNYDTDIFPRLDRDDEPMRHALGAEEGVRVVLDSPLHRRAWGRQEQEAQAEGVDKPPRRADKLVVCRAGEWTFHVGPYGDLCLCMMLREPSVSLREMPLRRAWQEIVPRWLEIERTQPSPCVACPDLRYCVPCAGRNYLETGDPERPAPAMCARVRATAQAMRENSRRKGAL